MQIKYAVRRKKNESFRFWNNEKRTDIQSVLFFGAPAGIRTPDTLLKRQVLCLLSYWGIPYIFYEEERRSGNGVGGLRLSLCPATEWSAPAQTWLGRRDSNPQYQSQSLVCYRYTTSHRMEKGLGLLPIPFIMGWVKGLEPSTPGTTIRCSNQLSYTHHIKQWHAKRDSNPRPTA